MNSDFLERTFSRYADFAVVEERFLRECDEALVEEYLHGPVDRSKLRSHIDFVRRNVRRLGELRAESRERFPSGGESRAHSRSTVARSIRRSSGRRSRPGPLNADRLTSA